MDLRCGLQAAFQVMFLFGCAAQPIELTPRVGDSYPGMIGPELIDSASDIVLGQVDRAEDIGERIVALADRPVRMLLVRVHFKVISRLRGSIDAGRSIQVMQFVPVRGVVTRGKSAIGGPSWRGIVLLRRERDQWRPIVDGAAAGLPTPGLEGVSVLSGQTVAEAVAHASLRRAATSTFLQFSSAASGAMGIVGMFRAAIMIRDYLNDSDPRVRTLACLVLSSQFPGQGRCLGRVKAEELRSDELAAFRAASTRTQAADESPRLLAALRQKSGRYEGVSSTCDYAMLLTLSEDDGVAAEALGAIRESCSKVADIRYFSQFLDCGDTLPRTRLSCELERIER